MTSIFFLFVIFIIGISVIVFLVKVVSSFIFGKPFSSMENSSEGRYTSWGRQQHNSENIKSHKKIFPKNEGEYVKYEEIKD